MSWLSNLFSGGSKPQTVATPSWTTDPIYSDLQTFLQEYGKNMMQGDIPEFFKSIGEPTDPTMKNNYITEAMKPYLAASQEQAAAGGTGRNPLDANTLAGLGNMSATLQFNDYLRAMQGKEDLLSLGTGITTGTRDSANQNQVNQNMFNQWKWSADTANANTINQGNQARFANQSNLFGGVLQAAAPAAAAIPGIGTGVSKFLSTLGNGISGIGTGPSNDKTLNVNSDRGNIDGSQILEMIKKMIASQGAKS